MLALVKSEAAYLKTKKKIQTVLTVNMMFVEEL